MDPGQPGARPALTYSLAPGATVQDSVVLRNYSNVPLTFRVYATDAYNNKTGDFAFLDGNTPPKDVGSWVKVSAENITLQPETGVDIPIEITVPADAQPGDHSGAILASSRTSALDGDGRQALLDRRVGSRIYLRVDGKMNPALVVEDLETEYHGGLNPLSGDVDVSYTRAQRRQHPPRRASARRGQRPLRHGRVAARAISSSSCCPGAPSACTRNSRVSRRRFVSRPT